MFATTVAVMCHLLVAQRTIAADPDCTAEEERIEEIITDTTLDPKSDFMYCMIKGLELAADWKGKHPIYHSDKWRIGKVKCAPGHYEVRGRA